MFAEDMLNTLNEDLLENVMDMEDEEETETESDDE